MKRHEKKMVSRHIELEESDWELIKEMFLPQRLQPSVVVRQIVHRQCSHWRSKLEGRRDGASPEPGGEPEAGALEAKIKAIFSMAEPTERGEI